MKEKTKGKKLSEEHKRKISAGGKRVWESIGYREKMAVVRPPHPQTEETKRKISAAQKGRKNPWTVEYNKTRPKVSGWKHTEEAKRKISKGVKGKNNGMYGKTPSPVNPVIYERRNGEEIILRSSWEAKFAEYLDKNNIDWEYETRTYSLSNGLTYTPDFITNDVMYEVKGYFHEDNKEKFYLFKTEYPNEKIILANRKYLTEQLSIKL